MDVSQGDEPKKECKVCRKQIDSSRHRMHELGCMRQNYWCDLCKQAIPKSEKETHDCQNPNASKQEEVKQEPMPMPNLKPVEPVQPAAPINIPSALLPQEESKQQSSLLGGGGAGRPPVPEEPAMPGGMSAYEQMLFQQFADGNDGADALMGGGGGAAGFGGGADVSEADMAAMQAMQDELNVRKADSQHEQQLIGGDDDFDFGGGPRVGPGGLQMQRQPGLHQPPAAGAAGGGGLLSGALDLLGQAHQSLTHAAYGGGGQQQQQQQQQMQHDSDALADFDEGHPDFQQPVNFDEEIPAEEMDADLQRILELSKNDK